jgi:two-component system cell cycle sensor histidine kinase PleC
MYTKVPTYGRSSLLTAYAVNCGQMVSRRRSERALRAAHLESAMASRAKSEFLANMSQELRTPLNAIVGFSALLKDGGVEGEAKTREYAEHISVAGNHLLRIITDILDISKIESGHLKLDIQEEDVAQIVNASLSIIRMRVSEKKQQLDVRMPDNLPFLPADSGRVRQILINLLSNANKFTPEGGKIVLLVSCDQPGYMTFAVSDTGQGMTEEEIAIALKPFSQVQSSYSRSQEGTGLGLPIAKALVLKHGGKFQIKSRPGAGTTVAFALPLTYDAAKMEACA